MISFYIDKNSEIRMATHDRSTIYAIVKACRKYHIPWDPDRKSYKIPLKKVEIVYEAVNDIDEVEGYSEVFKFVQKALIPESEIQFSRRTFDPTLLRSPPFKGKAPYEDFQLIDAQRMYNRNRYGLFLEQGLGKAQRLTDVVLTPSGYKMIKDLTIGDKVCTPSGKTAKILQKFPQGKQKIYKIVFGDNTCAYSTKEHLWKVRDSSRNWVIKSLKEILQKGLFYGKNNNPNWYIPATQPLEFPEKSHIIHPYIMGILIAEGNLTQQVLFYTPEQFIIDKIKKIVPNNIIVKERFKEKNNCYAVSLLQNQHGINYFKNELVRLGLFGKKSLDKFIPEDYLLDSLKNRILLLQGLIDGDGYIGKPCKNGCVVQYSTSSKLLYESVKFLVQSLGGLARGRSKIPKFKGRKYSRTYILTINLPEKVQPCSLPAKMERYPHRKFKYKPIRSIKSVEYFSIEEACCILIDDPEHLYITNDCIVTHNTWITIAALNHIWRDEGVLKTVIITTGSGVYTFYRELRKFAVGLNMDRVTIGDKKNREPFSPDVDIVVMSYRSFLLISDHYYKKNTGQSFVGRKYRKAQIPFPDWIGSEKGIMVLDESHSIANPKARQTKVIHSHSKYFYYRYELSGTPADSPEKWYSQLKFLDPALVKGLDYWTWAQNMGSTGTKYSTYVVGTFSIEKLEELNRSVPTISSRRFAKDCLDLPEHTIKKLYLPLSKKHRGIYKGFIEYYMETMIRDGAGGIKTREAIGQFQHLILAVDNPEMLKDHCIVDKDLEARIAKFSFIRDHSKIKILLELLEEHKGEQIVIWTSHPSVSDQLEELLLSKKITTGKIHGGCIPRGMDTNKFKEQVVAQFISNKFRVLLAATQMLTTSITMTNACIQIFFDRTFNYTEFSQVLCRIYRIGQTRPVISYIPIIDYTLDVTRDKNLENRDFFNKEFLTEEYVTKEIARRMFAPAA